MFHIHSFSRKQLTGILLFSILLFAVLQATTAIKTHGAPLDLQHASWRQTVSLYQRNDCLTSEQVAYGKEIIKGLNYNSQRIFRVFCRMPVLSFAQCQNIWSLLINHHLTFEQVRSFEQWSGLNETDIDLSLRAVPAISTLSYAAGKTLNAFSGLPDTTPGFALELIPMLNKLPVTTHQALQAMLVVKGMTAKKITAALLTIHRLSESQAMATTAYAQLEDMDTATLFEGLPLISRLRKQDAWNAHFLFASTQPSSKEAWDWLIMFFALPPDIQETQVSTFEKRQKKQLLQGMQAASQTLIWEINNLHALTDRFGRELSSSTLHQLPPKELYRLFNQLSPVIRVRYGNEFSAAIKAQQQGTAVNILRKATSATRSHIASSLTSINIYALLSQGSELYDSSFRDILVPVLQRRLTEVFTGNLLLLLESVDPTHFLVAQFITSCAQKGKLAAFFPKNGQQQQQVLDLVAQSAFRDPASLLVFTATMQPLFNVLKPDARSYLVQKMINAVQKTKPETARLLIATLQYYHQHHQEFLTGKDRKKLRLLEQKYGRISFAPYLRTPFAEWKQDNSLVSLSLFHPDDDGRQSFYSFARHLLQKGYLLQPAPGHIPGATSPLQQKKFRDLITQYETMGPHGLSELFQLMETENISVAFSRTLNHITIRHTLSVYANLGDQQERLLHFVTSGHEMLIQRGHSYWRKEQITDPITTLIKRKMLTQPMLKNKQRFLSIGSCGGVKVYSHLNQLFEGSVDILATIGTGLTEVNTSYNTFLFEFIATHRKADTWDKVTDASVSFFQAGRGQDYLQPGSLTAILHKMFISQPGSILHPKKS